MAENMKGHTICNFDKINGRDCATYAKSDPLYRSSLSHMNSQKNHKTLGDFSYNIWVSKISYLKPQMLIKSTTKI